MRFRPRPCYLVEALECRKLLAGDPAAGYALPFSLDFNRSKPGIADRDGTQIGFTYVQPNRNGDEYQPSLIDMKIGAGILRLYTTGTAQSGSNLDGDNTLDNALATTFAASSKAWVISTRILGPFPQINQNNDEGGLLFGPDEDNYVKLVVADVNGQQGLQFSDEQKFSTGYKHYLPQSIYNIGSFASINTLDLYLAGDPTTGYITAFYRINGGNVVELSNTLILKDDKRTAFFAGSAYAGVMAQQKNDSGGFDITFDQFAVQRGVLTPTASSSAAAITTGAQRVFNDVRGTAGEQIGVSVKNTGNSALTIPANGLTITGTNASMFAASIAGNLPVTIQAGQSASLKLTFTAPSSTALGIKTANLAISSNDPMTPVKNVALRGIATAGQGGTNEPSLQRILDLYQIPDNVGDSNPDDVFLDDPPITPNDELEFTQFKKAGPGNVTIQPLAVFGVASTPTLRFGTYEPGTPDATTELFDIDTADAQTVNPVPVGTTSFDPGSTAFSLYTDWPGFKNTDGTLRTVYQEDQFNTWDTGDMHHIRFYPYKTADGTVVANTYVFAEEETNAAKDNQDIVGIISNVTSAAAGPEIGTQNLDGLPSPYRLVFNKFQTGDPNFPSTVSHTQAKLRVRNTGTSNLLLSSIVASGSFSVLSSTSGISIAPGKFSDVLVQFNGGSTIGLKTGTLTINSNDADEGTKVISLAGYFQPRPEGNVEPTLATLVNGVFGYTTQIVGPGQNINTGGKAVAVGDEVMSGYWRRAVSNSPVIIKQIAAYHTQGNTASFEWYAKVSTSTKTVFTSAATDAQTLYPRQSGNLSAQAGGMFTPSGVTTFGFRIDAEWSDDTKNVQEKPGGGYGHHIRFYPLKDANGVVVPNTYLLVIDYGGINYDYNDNIYVISNIMPAPARLMKRQAAMSSMAPMGRTIMGNSTTTPTAARWGSGRLTPARSSFSTTSRTTTILRRSMMGRGSISTAG